MNNNQDRALSNIDIEKKEKEISDTTDSRLTLRETEVLKLIAAGYTNKEIADALEISQRTVDGHKSNMLMKTGSKNIIVLLKWALNKSIITF